VVVFAAMHMGCADAKRFVAAEVGIRLLGLNVPFHLRHYTVNVK